MLMNVITMVCIALSSVERLEKKKLIHDFPPIFRYLYFHVVKKNIRFVEIGWLPWFKLLLPKQ